MTRFEKALVYALFVLAGISMLLTGRRIEALEQQVKALEMRDTAPGGERADVCTFCVDKKYQKRREGDSPLGSLRSSLAGAPFI